MIKRLFSPIPFILFLLFLAISGYFINSYMPNSYTLSNTKIDISSESKSFSSILTPKVLAELSSNLNDSLKTDKLPPDYILSYLENNQSTSRLYPAEISLHLPKDFNELSLDIAYTPRLFHIDTEKHIIEKLKSNLLLQLETFIELQKSYFENELVEKTKKLQALKKEELHEEVIPEKPLTKPMIPYNKLPIDIIGDINKFKEFKSQEEIKLQEIQDQLSTLPLPRSSPLVMLTSNLQKNYEMQLIVLDGKKDWLRNSDVEQVKKIESEKQMVVEKLKFENIKLRDESYYIKGQQDKALREKHSYLLREEKSKKEVLTALIELQNSVLEKSKNFDNTSVKTDDSPHSQAVKDSNNNEEITLKEIATIKEKIASLTARIENLKTNGITSSIPIETQIKVSYYTNSFVIMILTVAALTLWLLTGIVFGSSNKVSSAKIVSSILEAPFLGTIPDLPNEGLENAKHKKLTDAIDHITDGLATTLQNKEIKTINILSPKNLDGRTQLTGMLSLSFNLKKNMKIIALDTCFNNPKLADFLELKTKLQPNEEGLIAYFKHLVETKEISETDNNQWLAKLVKPCIRNGIFVISPGSGSFVDSNTFNSRVIMTMYEGLGKYVDLIISDTPPLDSNLSFVSKILAENSSGNILLIKKGVYKKKELESIKKKLMGVNILGFILK